MENFPKLFSWPMSQSILYRVYVLNTENSYIQMSCIRRENIYHQQEIQGLLILQFVKSAVMWFSDGCVHLQRFFSPAKLFELALLPQKLFFHTSHAIKWQRVLLFYSGFDQWIGVLLQDPNKILQWYLVRGEDSFGDLGTSCKDSYISSVGRLRPVYN